MVHANFKVQLLGVTGYELLVTFDVIETDWASNTLRLAVQGRVQAASQYRRFWQTAGLTVAV